jgi:hypothetical protein
MGADKRLARLQRVKKTGRGTFIRDRLPDWLAYADRTGLPLTGKGKWRTTRCDFHGGSDSLRVNTDSGGWVCMSCSASGGDTLAHYMQISDAPFVDAATALGAWEPGDEPAHPQHPRALSAGDGLSLLYADAMVLFVIGSDIGQGKTPSATDRASAAAAARRVLVVYKGVRR